MSAGSIEQAPPGTPGAGALLVIVDVQNDFCEGGALAVEGGSAVAERIRAFAADRAPQYAAIALSQDWHRPDTDNGGHFAADPDFRNTWPVHCAAGTEGAALHPRIRELLADLARREDGPAVMRVRKGYGLPAYSALEGGLVTPEAGEGDDGTGDDGTGDGHETAPFARTVADGAWERVDVVGLALDHCVAATARDALAVGVPTRILRDLSAPVDPAGADRLCADLARAGITITTSTTTAGGPDHG